MIFYSVNLVLSKNINKPLRNHPSNDLRVNLGTISNQSRTIYESTTYPTATYIYHVYIP